MLHSARQAFQLHHCTASPAFVVSSPFASLMPGSFDTYLCKNDEGDTSSEESLFSIPGDDNDDNDDDDDDFNDRHSALSLLPKPTPLQHQNQQHQQELQSKLRDVSLQVAGIAAEEPKRDTVLPESQRDIEDPSVLDNLFPDPIRTTYSLNYPCPIKEEPESKVDFLSELVDDLEGITEVGELEGSLTTGSTIHTNSIVEPTPVKISVLKDSKNWKSASDHSSSFASITSDIFDDFDEIDELDLMPTPLPITSSNVAGTVHDTSNSNFFANIVSSSDIDNRPTKKQRIVHPSMKVDDMTSNKNNGANAFRDFQKDQWFVRFQELCSYRKKFGHCHVPHGYKDNLPLARWIKRQRYQYKLRKEGKPSTITLDRIKALEDLGIIWDSQNSQWEDRLNELKEFQKANGHCNVPSSYPENQKLAVWVKVQRRQHKLLSLDKMSNMTPDRIEKLNTLGFTWEIRKTDYDSS